MGIKETLSALFRGPDRKPVIAEGKRFYPEIPLKEEWERQADRYVELGFHRELNLTIKTYLESLPQFTPQPESFRRIVSMPVLVERRISPQRQCDLARIQYFLGYSNVKDWPEDPRQYKTPDVPYATWVDEGARFMGKSVKDVRKELAPDERGGTEFDGIALYIVKPQILKTRSLDLPGSSSVRNADTAFLGLFSFGPPELAVYIRLRLGWQPTMDVHYLSAASPRSGSLVCGRQK